MIRALRRFSISLHHFVIKRFIAEYGRIGRIPAVFVIYLQLVVAFDDNDIDVAVDGMMKKSFAAAAVMRIPEGEKGEKEQTTQDQLSRSHNTACLSFDERAIS